MGVYGVLGFRKGEASKSRVTSDADSDPRRTNRSDWKVWVLNTFPNPGAAEPGGPWLPFYRGSTFTLIYTLHARKNSSGRVIIPKQRRPPTQHTTPKRDRRS